MHVWNERITECVTSPSEPLICPDLQTISKEKIYIAESKSISYAYPRLDYRLMDNRLVVETKFKFRYRILMRTYERDEVRKYTKCFSPEWISDSLTCLLFEGDRRHALPTAMLENQSKLTTVFAILTHPNKHAWALHIRTYRMPADSGYDFDVELGCAYCLANFLVGISLACCCKGCGVKKSKRIELRFVVSLIILDI